MQTATTGITVQKTEILGTRTLVFSAWERVNGHDTISFSVGQGCYGRIGTNPDSAKYAHLPAMSVERSKACRAAYEEVYERAYAAIVAEHPEAINGQRSMGEIRITI